MEPNAEPLRPCRNTFTQQYGLPCSHHIAGVIARDEKLHMNQLYTRWWLRKPLDARNPLLLIGDPAYVTSLRGRPRGSRNKKKTVPDHLRAKGPSSRTSSSALRPTESTARAPMPSTEAGEPRPSPPDSFSTIILPVPTSHVQSQLPQTTEPGGTLPPPLLPASTSNLRVSHRQGRRRVSAAGPSVRVSGVSNHDTKLKKERPYELPRDEIPPLEVARRRPEGARGPSRSRQPRRRPSLSSGSLMKLSRTLRDEASRLICAL
ncbi:uncharacterized protein CPUR_07910 [Claviceps purpurea 20.1]|uniref:Uncharacterized protein n=1 Tax=Claviceps purpurea (strain 20.1) TaxID=1111077 RepID=M1VYE3_CLAP2|nr:uncharacterized protein CPUR_07910 [Claviceps purpurea 20.1]